MHPELFSIPIPGGYAALSYLAAVVALAMAVWFIHLYRKQKLFGDLIFIVVLIAGSVWLFKDASGRRAQNLYRTKEWAAALDGIEKKFLNAPKSNETEETLALDRYVSSHSAHIRNDQRWYKPLADARESYYAAVGIQSQSQQAHASGCGCGACDYRASSAPVSNPAASGGATGTDRLTALRAYRTAVKDSVPRATEWMPAELEFHGYSTFLMLAFLSTTLMSLYRAKRIGMRKNDILDFAVVAVVCGVFGARAGAVFEQPDKFFFHEYHVERKEMREQCSAQQYLVRDARANADRHLTSREKQPYVALLLKLNDRLLVADEIDSLLYDKEQYESSGTRVSVIGYPTATGASLRLAKKESIESELKKHNQANPASGSQLWREYSVDEIKALRSDAQAARDSALNELSGSAMPAPFGKMIELYAEQTGLKRADALNENYDIGNLGDIQSRLAENEKALDRQRSRLRDAVARNELTTSAVDFLDGRDSKDDSVRHDGALKRMGALLWLQQNYESLPSRKSEFLTWYAPFQVWAGGLTVLGGVILATIGLWIFCLRRGIKFFEFADFLGPLLIIGLGFGRVGCFVNGCCSGAVVTPDWYESTQGYLTSIYPPGSLPDTLYDKTYNPADWVSHCSDCELTHAPDRPPQHPAPLYSVFVYWFLLAPFLEMVYVRRKFIGQAAAYTLLLYAPTRFMLEAVRNEPVWIAWFTVAQWTTIGIFLIGIWFWYYGSKNGRPGIPPSVSQPDVSPSPDVAPMPSTPVPSEKTT
ncbi:MAG: prolipoprotein diacylglyceryl transferase family protein [Planctomycetota bacterium]